MGNSQVLICQINKNYKKIKLKNKFKKNQLVIINYITIRNIFKKYKK